VWQCHNFLYSFITFLFYFTVSHMPYVCAEASVEEMSSAHASLLCVSFPRKPGPAKIALCRLFLILIIRVACLLFCYSHGLTNKPALSRQWDPLKSRKQKWRQTWAVRKTETKPGSRWAERNGEGRNTSRKIARNEEWRHWNRDEHVTWSSSWTLFCEISSSHGGEYDVQSCLLGYTAV
jgi:hypothetical protein